MRTLLALVVASLPLVAASPALGQAGEPKGGPPPMPPARRIPGLTAPDAHPNGCVDCHVVYPEMKLDARLSVQMAKAAEKVEPKLLEAAKKASPDPSKVKGKHPKVASFKNVPASCMPCHRKDSKTAPPFDRLMHAIHLGGDEKSPFLTMFQGECGTCHKLDPKTFVQRVPSAAEKPAK